MSCRNFDVHATRSRYGAVTVMKEPKKTTVILYNTPVVVRTDKQITLRTGGWATQSTQTAINRALRQFLWNPPFVSRSKGQLFVDGKPMREGHRIRIDGLEVKP